MAGRIRFPLPLLGLTALVLGAPADTQAASSSGGEEYLNVVEAVEPNVIFLVDMSSGMDDPCPSVSDGDSGDSGDSGIGPSGPTPTSAAISSTDPCIQVVMDTIAQVSQHYDWARFGVVGTSDNSTYGNSYFPIVPLGATHSELATAVATVTASHGVDTRNLAESLEALADDYLGNTSLDDGVDDDSDGFDQDWAELPIEYWCQETHIITISLAHGEDDDSVSSSWTPSVSNDVMCDSAGISSTTDTECLYDNIVYDLYNTDVNSHFDDDQNVTVHTIGLGVDSSSVAEGLFGNASDVTGGEGLYTVAEDADSLLAQILLVMKDVREGTYSRSAPSITAEGDYIVFSFYEITGDNPLAEGHVRGFTLDTDPESGTYGQIEYDTSSSNEFEGALWDAGTLLVSRPVPGGEDNPDDRDGVGFRDIYTFFGPAVGLMTESTKDRRQGFDIDFVNAVGPTATLDYILDTDADTSGCATDDSYDFNDDCAVDEDDLQALVDFARGLPEAEFRYLDMERGSWKLGDSPHSQTVIVRARDGQFAVDPTYRKFLRELEANEEAGVSPAIVLIAANDGMLHAFALENESSDNEAGEELWGWIPGQLLYREQDAEWSGRLVDLMLYGRTFVFDGSPVVEDVWIDADDDGVKDCASVPDDCEWRRVVVVQQGLGGTATLALDITDTNDPTFLWEQTDDSDITAMGYTVGRPAIFNIYDNSDSSDPRDRWVALWPNGRGAPYSSTTTNYYESAEPALYMWSVGDDYWGSTEVYYQDDDGTEEYAQGDVLDASEVDFSVTDSDSDGDIEYGYIAAAVAAVDVDSDGDVDAMYFPVTFEYDPDSAATGSEDPGQTFLFKACLDPDAPGDFEWVEFYDPVADGALSDRPAVYYSATTAWHEDGSLGVYWGTGTPYERTGSDNGYFFAVKDPTPGSCDLSSGDYNVEPIDDCGTAGVKTLDSGEGLTGEPVVYAGTVFYSTWVPDTDRCEGGKGRIYSLDYEDCSDGVDLNGDGTADEYEEFDDTYISTIVVSEQGDLFYGIGEGNGELSGHIDLDSTPFLTTDTIAWMEIF